MSVVVARGGSLFLSSRAVGHFHRPYLGIRRL